MPSSWIFLPRIHSVAVSNTSAAPLAPGSAPVAAGADPGARGAAEVFDTATLWIRGRKIQLEGILADGDPRMVRPLARFLRRREVICAPTGGPERYRCSVDGQDLSEVILSNGGARATPDAPAELLAAEDEARSARLGIWRNM